MNFNGTIALAKQMGTDLHIDHQPNKYYCALPAKNTFEAVKFLESVGRQTGLLYNKTTLWGTDIAIIIRMLEEEGRTLLLHLEDRRKNKKPIEEMVQMSLSFRQDLFARLLRMGANIQSEFFEVIDYGETSKDAWVTNAAVKTFGNALMDLDIRKDLELSPTALKVARYIYNGGRILFPISVNSTIQKILTYDRFELAQLFQTSVLELRDSKEVGVGLIFGMNSSGWKLLTVKGIKNGFKSQQLYFSGLHSVEEQAMRASYIDLGSFDDVIPTPMTIQPEGNLTGIWTPMRKLYGVSKTASSAPPDDPPYQEEPEEEEEVKKLLDFYITNKQGERISDVEVGNEVYLVVKTLNLVGETMNLNLANKEADFEYQGQRLENDILSGYTIGSSTERILLKVLKPELEEEEEEEKKLLDFYITNKEGEPINEIKVGSEVYLVVETANSVGETMDLSLNNEKVDFEYMGNRLENDTLSDYTIGSDMEKILLKIIPTQE